MSERRGWGFACILLLLAAVTGAGAVREHWLTCRGSMLSGNVLRGYTYGADFSDACLLAMDNGFSFAWPDGKDPGRAEAVFGIAFCLLLALAWSVVVWTSAWSRSTKLVAGSPALLTAAAGLVTALGPSGDAVSSAYSWLLMLIDVAAVVAFFVVAVRERPDHNTRWRVALALLASTAVGFVPMMADYAFMTSISDANWDTPPGTGYPTVVAVVLLTLALLVLNVAPLRHRTVDDQDSVEALA